MERYGIGDRITCIHGNCVHWDAQASKLNEGQRYTIRAFHLSSGHVELEGVVGVFSPQRFEVYQYV